MRKKEEKREIPKKNYYIVLIVSVLIIAMTLYIRSFYINYLNSKYENGVLSNKSISQINIDDIDYAIAEVNEAILYISYTNDKKVSLMENRLYREIENKGLNDQFIYCNITKIMENDYITILKDKFPNLKNDIKKAPMFIYIKDGQAIEVIDSSNTLIDYKVLNTLLNKYGIE